MVDWDHLGAVAARSVARHAAVFALTGGAGTPFAVFADLMDLLDGVDALDAVDAADAGSSTSSTGGHHEISFTGHGTGGGLGAGAYPDLYYDPTNELYYKSEWDYNMSNTSAAMTAAQVAAS